MKSSFRLGCQTITFGGGHALAAFVNWGMPEDFPVIGDEMLIGPHLCAARFKKTSK